MNHHQTSHRHFQATETSRFGHLLFRSSRIWRSLFTMGLLGTLALSTAWAVDVPVPLPRPDDTPPATDKPVKVYILSGQSNMVGFGRVAAGRPHYSSIFLSADPSIKPCKMPVGSSALLPHRVYLDASGEKQGARAFVYKGAYDSGADYQKRKPLEATEIALGTVNEDLPTIDDPHTVIVEAYIEVPLSGMHEIHPGYGDSSYAIAVVDGQEVYRREAGGEATITKVRLEKGKRYPVTLTYLKGGKASFWMELVDLKTRGNLEALVEAGRFHCMVDDDGKWIERNDVMLNSAYLEKGNTFPLKPVTRLNDFFGPELGFGQVMGTYHDEPVLLIKANVGNRSLGWDILPPGTETWEYKGKINPGYGLRLDENGKPVKPATEKAWYAGKVYDQYTESIRRELDQFDEKYPQYKDQGYEIAGFVWWQGHKDQNEAHAAAYEKNLVNLINAWRKEFNAPKAKWAIATIAFGGWKLDEPGKTIAEAQLAVSDYEKYPEHKGNVRTIEARDFWRDVGESPQNQSYHYNHNAETYLLVGDALGRAMVEMLGGTAAPRVVEPHLGKPDAWPEQPSLEEAARMVYSDAFINTWSNDPAEPTKEELQKMAPAMRPFVVDGAISAFVENAPKILEHKRRSLQLIDVVTGKGNKWTGGPGGELDTMISYYNLAGIHDYDWKPFGPAMQQAEWYYYSFDPSEKLDLGKSNRYRDITLPQGMENWYAKDFDPAQAGWKKGSAPFGQNDGVIKPLNPKCTNPQCGCGIQPKTLWEKEVLLMQQTFDLPELRKDRRYRLIVGGSAHSFSGEGYALYINGKLVSESETGFFKRGSIRGVFIDNEMLPELKSGKVTIAAKSFLRTTGWIDRASPPRGHLSVWLEEAQLPEVVTKALPETAQ